jgi:hypothetical protein
MSAPTSSSPFYAVDRVALDGRLAFQFEPECGEERCSRREVVDDNADVLQALDGHERPPGSWWGVYSSWLRYFGIVVSWCVVAAPLAATGDAMTIGACGGQTYSSNPPTRRRCPCQDH